MAPKAKAKQKSQYRNATPARKEKMKEDKNFLRAKDKDDGLKEKYKALTPSARKLWKKTIRSLEASTSSIAQSCINRRTERNRQQDTDGAPAHKL